MPKTVAQLEKELAASQKALADQTSKLTELQEAGFAIKPIKFTHVKGQTENGVFQGVQIDGPFRFSYLKLNAAKAILNNIELFKAAVESQPTTVQRAQSKPQGRRFGR